jgi:hypothetical protein
VDARSRGVHRTSTATEPVGNVSAQVPGLRKAIRRLRSENAWFGVRGPGFDSRQLHLLTALTRYGDKMRMRRYRAIGVMMCLVLALSACTHQDDDEKSPRQHHEDENAYAGRLPNLCDDLISPVTVAQLLGRDVSGQRTYTYDQPERTTGLLRGMTCEHGVDADGPKLKVTAREFGTRAEAKAAYRDLTAKQAPTSGIQVLRRPGAIGVSPSSASLAVLDRTRTVDISLRSGTVAAASTRRTLLLCARAVIQRLDGPS